MTNRRNSLIYNSPELEHFYLHHRNSWKDFYRSEKKVFEQIWGQEKPIPNLLDAGCAVGGLASALDEKFGILEYTGVEINPGCVETARKVHSRKNYKSKFICGDILNTTLPRPHYQYVISLSCIDWNIHPEAGLDALWDLTAPMGTMVFSIRITLEKGSYDLGESYQRIDFSGKAGNSAEKACYVVYEWKKLLGKLHELNPESIYAEGYWGSPSLTAETPHEKLVFGVFALKKRAGSESSETSFQLNLPKDFPNSSFTS